MKHIKLRVALLFLFYLVPLLGLSSSLYAQTAPKPIDGSELDGIARQLSLSEDQKAALFYIHQQLLEEWNRSLAADWATYTDTREQAIIAVDSRLDLFIGDSVQETQALANRLMSRLAPRIESLNAQFFTRLESILTDDQLRQLPRVKLDHQKKTYGYGARRAVREIHLDPIELVEAIPMSDQERLAVDAVIAEYEPQFVSALIEARKAEGRGTMLRAQAADVRRPAANGEVPWSNEIRNESDLIIVEAQRLCVPKYKRLVEIIRDGFRRFGAVLSSEHTALLEATRYELAYPEVDPDPLLSKGKSLYKQIFELSGMTVDQKDALQILLQAYLDHHEQLSAEMRKTIFDMGLSWNTHDPDTYRDDWDRGESEIRQLGQQRDDLTHDQWNNVKSILTPEQIAALPPWPYQDKPTPKYWDLDNWNKIPRKSKSADESDPSN